MKRTGIITTLVLTSCFAVALLSAVALYYREDLFEAGDPGSSTAMSAKVSINDGIKNNPQALAGK